VGHQHRKLSDVLRLCLPHRHGIYRRSSFDGDGREDEVFCRVCRGDSQTVERRLDDAHSGALGFNSKQIAVRAQSAQQIAEGAEDHIGKKREAYARIDYLQLRARY
jgi:hypothetical protein